MKQSLALLIAAAVALGIATTPIARAEPSLSMEDRIALTDLISEYSHRWDGRDEKGWVDLFIDSAVIKAAFRGELAWRYGSNAERLTFIQGFYTEADKTGILQSRHYQTNTLFQPQADGSVRAETMFAVTFQHKGEPMPRFSNTGIYADRFVKTPAGWKFAERDIRVDQEPPAAP